MECESVVLLLIISYRKDHAVSQVTTGPTLSATCSPSRGWQPHQPSRSPAPALPPQPLPPRPPLARLSCMRPPRGRRSEPPSGPPRPPPAPKIRSKQPATQQPNTVSKTHDWRPIKSSQSECQRRRQSRACCGVELVDASSRLQATSTPSAWTKAIASTCGGMAQQEGASAQRIGTERRLPCERS